MRIDFRGEHDKSTAVSSTLAYVLYPEEFIVRKIFEIQALSVIECLISYMIPDCIKGRLYCI